MRLLERYAVFPQDAIFEALLFFGQNKGFVTIHRSLIVDIPPPGVEMDLPIV